MMYGLNPKRLLMSLMTVGVACSLPTLVQAGPMNKICSDCHTMHNSQSGGTMSDKPITSANAQLLRVDCAGCHADGGAANDGTTRTPQVGPDSAAVTGSMLAGGYFSAALANQAKTHNVVGISSADTAFNLTANDPPGWEGVAGAWVGDGGASEQLTCAGSTTTRFTAGCHIGGGHHANNVRGTIADGTTVGKSFRFLSGVIGLEDAEWEYTNDATNHNQYYAVLRAQGTANPAGINSTINGLCAQCHGNFHGQADQDAAGSWIRHPTDVDLNASASEHTSYTTYDPLVPVGSNEDPATPLSLVNNTVQSAGRGIVLCISCHRAHGSANNDLLRWAYADMVAGSTPAPIQGTGCFKCHRDKD